VLLILLVVLLALFVIGSLALSPLLWILAIVCVLALVFTWSRGRRKGN
jgi:hypothetical protein